MELIRAVVVSADLVGSEFVEYNPLMDDHARSTGLIVNNMIRELLTGIAMRKQGHSGPLLLRPDILGGTPE
jgi:arginase family enzyme